MKDRTTRPLLFDEEAVVAIVQEWLSNATPISQPLNIEILSLFVADRIAVGSGTKAPSRLDGNATLMIEKLIQRNENWRIAYQNLLSSETAVRK